MAETPVTLLKRLRSHADTEAWQQLVALYTPLLSRWLHRYSVQPSDSEDLIQEVFSVLVRELPHFQRSERRGAFRAWLRTILVHRLRSFWRARQAQPRATGDSDVLALLERLEDPHSDLKRLWDQEHDRHVALHLLGRIRSEFEPRTWQAFQRLVLEGASASEVATELGSSANAVLIAKSRVLQRLRLEARDLIE